MSATNRGKVKNDNEYYHTPKKTIVDFWTAFSEVEGVDITMASSILDPCAGGDEQRECAYPEALGPLINEDNQVAMFPFFTVDIRKNSQAKYKVDYLTNGFGTHSLIISNPPFTMFEQFVEKALTECVESGYVIFLLRLNALGGQERKSVFWDRFPAKYCFVHKKRPFADATEYAHFVWQKGLNPDCVKTYII